MSTVLSIRKRLGMNQIEFASAIGISQGSVSHIEVGRQTVMPDVARRIIAIAAERGFSVTFDDIYKQEHVPPRAATATEHGAAR